MTLAAVPPPAAIALARQLLAATPLQALAQFTWLNNVTSAAAHCRFAFEGERHCLARRRGLPFTAISLAGDDPHIVRRLAAELLAPGEAAYSLVPPAVAATLAAAVDVLDMRGEWQMLFQGEVADLDAGAARPLTAGDLPAMLALAASNDVMVFNAHSAARGVFYGVFTGTGELASMGGVQNELPGYAEIGSIVTHPRARRRGYAGQVVAALVRQLAGQDRQTFLCLFQTNHGARRLYEKFGFTLINELQLVHWHLPVQ